jgi:hypothetical protein
MLETPAQPSHVAELALLAGFILLLLFETLLVPAARRTARDVERPRDAPSAAQWTARAEPPLPPPVP